MGLVTVFAQESGYWFAGVLTVAAATIVTVVILVSSRSGNTDGR